MSYSNIYARELTRIAESKLGASTILVYIALTKYDHLHTGFVYPNIARLQADLAGKYHRSSIEKALKNLEAAGLIKRNHKTSKRRFFLVVRKAAYAEFKMQQLAAEKEQKKLFTAPSHVTDGTRNMLRHNKNNLNRLYLSKHQIEAIGPMIQHERNKPKIVPWRIKFLLGIQQKSWKKKALTENQLNKFLELEKQYLSTGFSQGQIESGSKGGRIQNMTESSPDQSSNYVRGDHAELGSPEWGSPEWIAHKKSTNF